MLKKIDFETGLIPANGKVYKIAQDLTIARFRELEKMEVEFYYGITNQEMFNKLKEIYNDLNKPKIADASVKVYRLMEGVADRVDKRENIMLRICSLFLVTDDEDVNSWDEEMAKVKIEDWQKEGYAINDFFSLVANLVPGFMKDYESILNATLLEEEMNEKKNEQ